MNVSKLPSLTTVLIFAAIVSCATVKQPKGAAVNPDAARADTSRRLSAEMSVGKINFETHCATCHGLKNPVSKTATQWQAIVPKMAAKANKKAGNEVIDSLTQASILQYLVGMNEK